MYITSCSHRRAKQYGGNYLSKVIKTKCSAKIVIFLMNCKSVVHFCKSITCTKNPSSHALYRPISYDVLFYIHAIFGFTVTLSAFRSSVLGLKRNEMFRLKPHWFRADWLRFHHCNILRKLSVIGVQIWLWICVSSLHLHTIWLGPPLEQH